MGITKEEFKVKYGLSEDDYQKLRKLIKDFNGTFTGVFDKPTTEKEKK